MGLFLCTSAGANINLLGGGDRNLDPVVDLLPGNGGLALDERDDKSGNTVFPILKYLWSYIDIYPRRLRHPENSF